MSDYMLEFTSNFKALLSKCIDELDKKNEQEISFNKLMDKSLHSLLKMGPGIY